MYAGRLEVRLVEAKELTTDADLAQSLISGGARDPYVIFAMNEENEKGPKEGAIGLGRAVDRARSSTVWSKSVADQAKDRVRVRARVWVRVRARARADPYPNPSPNPSPSPNPNPNPNPHPHPTQAKEGLQGLFSGKEKEAEGSFAWPADELLTLYVKDPSRAQLAFTVFDEEVRVRVRVRVRSGLGARVNPNPNPDPNPNFNPNPDPNPTQVGVSDVALGAASVHLADLLKPNGDAAQREWSGWLPLTWRPAETNDNVLTLTLTRTRTRTLTLTLTPTLTRTLTLTLPPTLTPTLTRLRSGWAPARSASPRARWSPARWALRQVPSWARS